MHACMADRNVPSIAVSQGISVLDSNHSRRETHCSTETWGAETKSKSKRQRIQRVIHRTVDTRGDAQGPAHGNVRILSKLEDSSPTSSGW